MQMIISPNVQGVVVTLNKERFVIFQKHLKTSIPFGQPIPDFVHNNHYPLICFVIRDDHLCYFAKGKAGQRAGTQLRRVNISHMHTLHTTIPTKMLLHDIPRGKLRQRIENCLKNGGMFSHDGLTYVINKILSLQPDTREFFRAYMKTEDDWLPKAPTTVRFNIALQKEAVLTSIDLAGPGFDKTVVREWAPYSPTEPNSPAKDNPEHKTEEHSEGEPQEMKKACSFINGLPRKMTEQAILLKDFYRFPGIPDLKEHVGDIIRLESKDGMERLTIIYADRQPLEMQTGADLIYYNEVYHSFVFIQYKAMHGWEEGYRPNEQLKKQILSMAKMLNEAGPPTPTECHEFRLHTNPFFLKLCPKVQFVKESSELSLGMYIPLEYWNFLEANGVLSGSHGGQVANINNVGRYLRNTEFAALVRDAWVGSSAQQSDKLGDIIKETLEAGNSVTYTVKQSFKKRTSR